jgi:hypothetical protein
LFVLYLILLVFLLACEMMNYPDAVLPTVLDVTVETPDYTHLTLKVRERLAYLLPQFSGCAWFYGPRNIDAPLAFSSHLFTRVRKCNRAF